MERVRAVEPNRKSDDQLRQVLQNAWESRTHEIGPYAEIMHRRRDTGGGTHAGIFSGKFYSQLPAPAVT